MIRFITGPLITLLGYAYPGYECYKSVQKSRPDVEALRFWLKYWVVLAALYLVEHFAYGAIAWFPFYSLLKLLFIIYLWHPRTVGTLYIYHRLLQPLLARYEPTIDRHLNELKARGSDMAVQYSRQAVAKALEVVQQGAALAPQMMKKYQSFANKSPHPSRSGGAYNPSAPPFNAQEFADYDVVDRPPPGSSSAPDSVSPDAYNLRSRGGRAGGY